MDRRSCLIATKWNLRMIGSKHVTRLRKSKIFRKDNNQPNRGRRTKRKMLRQSLVVLGIILVAASGTLAKKETAIPPAAGKQKQLALVRVNVTGQSYAYFRPWQRKAPLSKRALGGALSKGRVLVSAHLVPTPMY